MANFVKIEKLNPKYEFCTHILITKNIQVKGQTDLCQKVTCCG